MEIKEICYEFDPDAVLAGIETDIYDFDASVGRYIDLCESALRKAYPTAKIVIRKGSEIRTNYIVNGESDHEQLSSIEAKCDEVWYAEDDYKILHADITSILDAEQLVSIGDIHEEFGVSIGLLRWACSNGLITDATRVVQAWVLTRLNFHNFQRTFLKGINDASIWRVKLVGERVASITGVDHSEFLKQKIADTITDGITVLISPNMFVMPEPISIHNSYILVSGNHEQSQITIAIFDDVEPWETYPFGQFRDTLCKKIRHSQNCEIRQVKESTGKNRVSYSIAIEFLIESPMESFEQYINKKGEEFSKFIENTRIQLAGGLPWEKTYEDEEKPFQKYLLKLIEKLGYEVVKLEHGSFEFGKDILFADTTSFGIRRYYAIQAKKGNLSGDAKSDIDEILTQMEDAFTVPFREDQTLEHKHISAFIIAISGEFTYNAKEKIWARLLRLGRVGMVYFWDKNVVQDLMRKGSHQIKDIPVDSLQSMMPDFLAQKQSKERK